MIVVHLSVPYCIDRESPITFDHAVEMDRGRGYLCFEYVHPGHESLVQIRICAQERAHSRQLLASSQKVVSPDLHPLI